MDMSVQGGRLAQLVRAPALQAGCRGFESLTAHQFAPKTFEESVLLLQAGCRGFKSLTALPKSNGTLGETLRSPKPGPLVIQSAIACALACASHRTEPAMNTDPLLAQLHALLSGGNAHTTLETAVADFPAELRGVVPERLPYSAWQLVEHLRITQRDILDFSAPPAGGYRPLQWPADYWPKSPTPPTSTSWDSTLAALRADADTFLALLTKPEADLYTPFPWGEGQNLLRETLLIADHNSYHTGELIVLRRLLGIWPA